ncbi:MAG: hypothetical protein WCT50_01125 [Patescibacteria group bacterium]
MSNWLKKIFGGSCCCHKGADCCKEGEKCCSSEEKIAENTMPESETAPKMPENTVDSNSEAKTE